MFWLEKQQHEELTDTLISIAIRADCAQKNEKRFLRLTEHLRSQLLKWN